MSLEVSALKDFLAAADMIMKNLSGVDFCDRFKGYHYMATLGKEPFKTAFVINAIFNVPFCITATLANFLVIVSIWRSYTLRTPANMLLIGLALSDLGVGLLVQPSFIAFLFSFAFRGAERFTCISAVAVNTTASCLSCVSFGTVTAISLERYLSLRLHLRYEQFITIRRVRHFLVILWLLGGISPIVWILFVPRYKSYFYVTGILLCLLISTVAYIKICRIVRFHLRQIKNHQVSLKGHSYKIHCRKKSAYNMFIVYCTLLCCYVPYSICLALGKIMGYSIWNWSAINFALTVININSSLNPLIYCYRMREIRRAMLHTLHVTLRMGKAS